MLPTVRTTEILIERTRIELALDLTTAVDIDDNRTVFMRCQNCDEEFLRPIKFAHLPHNCRRKDGLSYLRQYKPLPRLECQLEHPDAKYPYRKRTTDAGHDLTSVESVIVPHHGMANVQTGIRISAPEGYYYTIDSRSSLYAKKIVPYRATIDATYTGLLHVALMNSSEEDYRVLKGDRIAQMVLHEVHDFDLVPVEEFNPEYTKRALAGFGSSGR